MLAPTDTPALGQRFVELLHESGAPGQTVVLTGGVHGGEFIPWKRGETLGPEHHEGDVRILKIVVREHALDRVAQEARLVVDRQDDRDEPRHRQRPPAGATVAAHHAAHGIRLVGHPAPAVDDHDDVGGVLDQ